MFSWHPTIFLAKQAAKIAAIRINALPFWHTVPSGHSTIMGVDPVAPVNMDFPPTEYCFDRGFHFLILARDDWYYDMIFPPGVLDAYTGSSRRDSVVVNGAYRGKLDQNIFFRLSDYCNVFQVEVITIYCVVQ